MKNVELALESIQSVVQVSPGKALTLLETSVWGLQKCSHTSGVPLKVVDGPETEHYQMTWSSEGLDLESIQRSYNQDDACQYGAEAIAFLVCVDRTDYTAVERAVTRTGIDYWLGFKETGPNHPFHKAGRLEVSGIMEETPANTVKARIGLKLRQTRPSYFTTFPVLAIVVEFTQPYATIARKNVNG